MPLLTPYNGLQFYISKLDGCLTFSLFINGKRVSKSEIWGIDKSQKEEVQNCTGTEVTAIGLELLLIKNDGTLELRFLGDTGSSVSWVFNGLELDSKGAMVAMTNTQTDVVAMRDVEV